MELNSERINFVIAQCYNDILLYDDIEEGTYNVRYVNNEDSVQVFERWIDAQHYCDFLRVWTALDRLGIGQSPNTIMTAMQNHYQNWVQVLHRIRTDLMDGANNETR